jgi:CheY-like chemotaxis protein
MRILVVEDDDDSREGLRLLLEVSGHRVETAANGPDGLRKLVSGGHDTAIVDIELPGMNGYEIARRARRVPALSGVRLIALTGYGREKDRAAAHDAGFDLHLTKPVSFMTLLRQIEG